MEITFNITDNFEKDLEKFNAHDQQVIENKINFYAQSFQQDPNALRHYSHSLKHTPGLTGSLYVLKITYDIRLLATFDTDPIFEQIIITLLGCVRHKDMDKSVNKISKMLYKMQMAEFVGEDSDDSN